MLGDLWLLKAAYSAKIRKFYLNSICMLICRFSCMTRLGQGSGCGPRLDLVDWREGMDEVVIVAHWVGPWERK